jgi:opacity protein-like surface antigen
MKKFMLAAIAAIALTTSAFAGDEVMASRYGNTTVITMANGSVVKIWYNADHTWTGEAGGAAIGGTWKVDGNQLCVSWNNPPPNMANPTCSMASERKIGDHWTVGEGDAKMSVTLAAGKQ